MMSTVSTLRCDFLGGLQFAEHDLVPNNLSGEINYEGGLLSSECLADKLNAGADRLTLKFARQTLFF